jgi:hypothetical protein
MALRLADPTSLLVKKAAHIVSATREVYLGGGGYEALDEAAFARFESLDTVWLNDNRLTALTGLDANFRLRRVYAHHNRIA